MKETNRHEKQFFNALRDIFVGAKVEGDSGYVNLMRIKSRYYEQGVFPQLQKDITAALQPFPDFREELFDKLYSFFQRYFSESGSIYFRYTSLHQNVYEKVYTDDRDVILFWKTHMLYYVKTDRIFTSLNVEVDGVKFFFDASKMTLKKSNEKREVIYSFRKVQPEDGALVFDVSYSEKGKTTRVDDILKDIKKVNVKLDDETLNKAFRVFEKQSEVDYFINKDARAFLREQFDLWMYQYLFAGQNVWSAERLAQLQALKSIAYKIIDFISQFEDELVKIWNKPKFVRNSHYVLTLNHVLARSAATKQSEGEDSQIASGEERPGNDNDANVVANPAEAMQSQDEGEIASGTNRPRNDNEAIVIARSAATKQSESEDDQIASGEECPGNDLFARLLAHPNLPQQMQEWRDLGMIGEDFRLEMLMQKDLTGAPLYPQYQYLPIDTKYFPDLELDILALFDDLDAALDGWLVHSENYQALNTLLKKFNGQIKAIYIDPPYNTSASEITYINNYKHSSWITFMENRINLSRSFLRIDGVTIVAIDDTEIVDLSLLLETMFPNFDRNVVVVNHHPAGAGLEGTNISTTHEYAIFMTPHGKKVLFGEKKSEGNGKIGFIRTGTAESNLRIGRPNSFYAVLVDPKNSKVVGAEEPPTGSNYPKDITKDGYIRIYPLSADGTERVWRRSYESCLIEIRNGNIECQNNKTLYLLSDDSGKHKPIFSNWTDTKYNAGAYGTNILTDILGIPLFSYPKSVFNVMDCVNSATIQMNDSLILDYFAGSGTTAHAVMNLNRADGGRRKYILVEMGEHFNTVILPRIKKVAFSDKWKDGKANGGQGMSHFVKYYDLEQYEDALRRAHYADADLFHNPYEDPYHSYVFLRDMKMLDSIEMDAENNKVHFHPERLYPDIDLAETLSQRRGKWIKRITAEYVEFQDGERMSLTDPDWQTIKPLVWWQ